MYKRQAGLFSIPAALATLAVEALIAPYWDLAKSGHNALALLAIAGTYLVVWTLTAVLASPEELDVVVEKIRRKLRKTTGR